MTKQNNKQKLDLSKIKESEEVQTLKAKLEKEQEEQQKELLYKLAIKSYIKGKTEAPINHVHIYSLYGVMASVDFYNDFRGDSANLEQVKELYEAFPPSPLFMVRDGCLSFKAVVKEDERGTVTAINGAYIKWEGFSEHAFIQCKYVLSKTYR